MNEEEISKYRKEIDDLRKKHIKKPSLKEPIGKSSFEMIDMFDNSEKDKKLFPDFDSDNSHHYFGKGADFLISVPHSGQVCISLHFRNATMIGVYNDIEAFKNAVNELYKNWKNKFWEDKYREEVVFE